MFVNASFISPKGDFVSTKSTSSGFAFPQADAVKPDRPLPQLPRHFKNLSTAFLHQVKATPDKQFARDTTGQKATYGEAHLGALAVARYLKKRLRGKAVGIMIPPAVGGALANIAATLLGKWAVNLNYAGKADMAQSAIDQCKIEVVVTTRKVLEKTGFQLTGVELVFIEDVKDEIKKSKVDKLWVGLMSKLPLFLLGFFLAGVRAKPQDIAAIMFTSGSTGDPKGVMWSHSNILSNIWQVKNHGRFDQDGDRLLGVLPFFHSFGFNMTLWAIIALGLSVSYHHSPLETKAVAKILLEHNVTVMACTPTLMRGYLARCTKEQFKTVRWLLLGSEKLRPELAAEIQDKLGVLPVEGFGCTELSPVVAANVPEDVVTPDGRTVPGFKLGAVGQPLPGTAIAIVDQATGKLMGPGKLMPITAEQIARYEEAKRKAQEDWDAADEAQKLEWLNGGEIMGPTPVPEPKPEWSNQGLIFVKGPQVMAGYLGREAETAQVLQNGWYCTGDIGCIDEDGFLHILDRANRFAKVAGEMVPIIRVEEAIREVTKTNESAVAIAAVPDDARGEKLVVLFVDLGVDVPEVLNRLKGVIHELWIPKAKDFYKVDALPVNPTGKLDMKEVKRVAQELVNA